MVSLRIFVAFICSLALPTTYGLGKIVGGNETTIDKRPYLASLQFDIGRISHTCGASIISEKYLLTSASCYPGKSIQYLYARVGSTAYNVGGQVLKVTSFVKHPKYVWNILDYDFAIVGFADGVKITMGPKVKAIKLGDNFTPSDGSMMTVAGWGVTSESSAFASINLKEVVVPVFNHKNCTNIFSFLTDRQVCIGGTPQGGQGACIGDSGGPAVQNDVQYALYSSGSSCEDPNVPGIFTKISEGRDWIKEMTGV